MTAAAGDRVDIGVHDLRIIVVQLILAGNGIIVIVDGTGTALSVLACAGDPEGVIKLNEIGVVVAGIHAAHIGGNQSGGSDIINQVPVETKGRVTAVVPPAVERTVGLEGHGEFIAKGDIHAAIHDLDHFVDQFGIFSLVPAENAIDIGAHHPHRAVVFQGHDIFWAQLHILYAGEDDSGGGVRFTASLAVSIGFRKVVAPGIEIAVLLEDGEDRAGLSPPYVVAVLVVHFHADSERTIR